MNRAIPPFPLNPNLTLRIPGGSNSFSDSPWTSYNRTSYRIAANRESIASPQIENPPEVNNQTPLSLSSSLRSRRFQGVVTHPTDTAVQGAIQIVSSSGFTVSGKVDLHDQSIPFSGKLEPSGSNQTKLTSKITLAGTQSFTLTLTLDLANRRITGKLESLGSFWNVLAEPLSTSASTRQIPAVLQSPNAQEGILSATVNEASMVSIVGKTSTGKILSSTTALCSNGRIPLFVKIPHGSASIGGWCEISKDQSTLQGTLLQVSTIDKDSSEPIPITLTRAN